MTSPSPERDAPPPPPPRRRGFLLAAALGLGLAGPGLAGPFTEALTTTVERLSSEAGVEVEVPPALADAPITFWSDGTRPLEALRQIGYSVGHELRPTAPGTMEFGAGLTREIPLIHADPTIVARRLSRIGESLGLGSAAADPEASSLVVTSPDAEGLRTLARLVGLLDQPGRATPPAPDVAEGATGAFLVIAPGDVDLPAGL